MTMDRPAQLDHPQLGTLSWEERNVAYQGAVTLRGQVVDFEVLVDPPAWTEPMTVSSLVDQGAAALAVLRTNWEKISERIGAFLVEQYDAEWRGERPVLSAGQLLAHLKLMTLTVYHDGHASLSFSDDVADDEGLFYGHYVDVTIRSSGEVSDVSLQG